MRPSIERARIAEPRYSMTRADAAADADARDDRRGSRPWPSRRAAGRRRRRPPSCSGRVCGSVCVARTCSTSLVPMPNASAPNAPCVEVWLSPQTIVMPGCVSPSSRPDDVDDALARVRPSGRGGRRTPRSCVPARPSALPRSGRPSAGRGRSSARCGRSSRASGPGGAPARFARRRPSNACGDVTSWTRWRSM